MRSNFPLFQSHLDVAHAYWKALVKPGDIVIDATCGNGQDTLLLSQLALTTSTGQVFAIDIQASALAQTKKLLQQHLSPQCYERVEFQEECHSVFKVDMANVKLIAYNLGYLPGGNKAVTTRVPTTVKSVTNALSILMPGGAISITCYPGHPEGKKEEEALVDFITALRPQEWECTHQRWLNRSNAPSLLLIQKLKEPEQLKVIGP